MECCILCSSLGQYYEGESDRDCDLSPCTAINEPAQGKFSVVNVDQVNILGECSRGKLRS